MTLTFINDESARNHSAGELAEESSQEPRARWKGKGPDSGLAAGEKPRTCSTSSVALLDVGAPLPESKVKGRISNGSIRNAVASPFSMMFKIRESAICLGWFGGPKKLWQGMVEKSIPNIE